MTEKVFSVNKFMEKLETYVCWNERLSDETRDALKTVAGWINNDATQDMVRKEDYEKLDARFRHLMESPYIRSFDEVWGHTGKYKREIRLALGPDEKVMMDGLSNCAFCGREATIVSKMRNEKPEGDIVVENAIACRCGAIMKGKDTVFILNSVGGLDCIKDGRYELIKAWNRRPTT